MRPRMRHVHGHATYLDIATTVHAATYLVSEAVPATALVRRMQKNDRRVKLARSRACEKHWL